MDSKTVVPFILMVESGSSNITQRKYKHLKATKRETPLLLNYFFKVSSGKKTKKHNQEILVVNKDLDNGW